MSRGSILKQIFEQLRITHRLETTLQSSLKFSIFQHYDHYKFTEYCSVFLELAIFSSNKQIKLFKDNGKDTEKSE